MILNERKSVRRCSKVLEASSKQVLGCSFVIPDELHRVSRVRCAVGELGGHVGGLVGWWYCRDASRTNARECCRPLEAGGEGCWKGSESASPASVGMAPRASITTKSFVQPWRIFPRSGIS
jgi:hypothetical protein